MGCKKRKLSGKATKCQKKKGKKKVKSSILFNSKADTNVLW